MIKKDRKVTRQRIKQRIRKKVFGTPSRPRLTVYKSLHHIYAQIVDDLNGKTLVSASSNLKELRDELKPVKSKMQVSKLVGAYTAKKALEASIKSVVFDRSGYQYHGHVKALADGAREGGLQF
jgi:large subunit ribosomal protein L18